MTLRHTRFLRFVCPAALILAGAIPPAGATGPRPRPHLERPAPSGLEDFDVRRDPVTKELNAAGTLKAAPHDPSAAIEALRARQPGSAEGLHVDLYASGLARKVINYGGPLTAASSGTPDDIARRFLTENAALFGLSARQVLDLEITMNNLDGMSGVTFLKYEQRVEGVRVFDSEISISVTPSGQLVIATAGLLLPQTDVPVAPALGQEEAIAKAFEHCGAAIDPDRHAAPLGKSASGLARYASPLGASSGDVLAETCLLDVHGEPRLAARVFVDKGPSEWYETLLDASSGELLYRRNLYRDVQGRVYTQHPDAQLRLVKPFAVDSAAFPGTPSGDKWLTGMVTYGNNVDAYIDRDNDNVRDYGDNSPGMSSGRAWAPDGKFDFPYTPDTVDPRTQRAAAITNLFYFCNHMHDWMYDLGFTETARNFQLNNYGRGGAGDDAVRAEAQNGSTVEDCGGVFGGPCRNNSKFAPGPDGVAPRMEMYLWDLHGEATPVDDRDAAVDGDVVLHEYGHGVSDRLIGNSSGSLYGVQSGALAEGWSDYWAATHYNDGVVGEYVTRDSEKGARRSAYDGRTDWPNGNYGLLGNNSFEPHHDGEVWCQALWDLRQSLAPTIGVGAVDWLVLAGIKNTALHPSMLDARDGIVAADQAFNAGANQCVIWHVFARHGMGRSASGNDGTTHDPATNAYVCDWGDWEDLGGRLTSGPGAVSTGPNRIDVVVRGEGDHIYHRRYTASGWGAWVDLGGRMTSDPDISASTGWTSQGATRLDVFARGPDNHLWHKAGDGTIWSGWEDLGGTLTSGPTAVSRDPDHIDVFARDHHNGLAHIAWDGSSWSAWEYLGGSLTSDPDAASWEADRLDVFARGENNHLWHIKWTEPSVPWFSAWSEWEDLGGTLTSGPTAVSARPNSVDVFVRGGDGHLLHLLWNKDGWGGWVDLGGTVNSDPDVASWGPDRLDVFGRGSVNGHLMHRAFELD